MAKERTNSRRAAADSVTMHLDELLSETLGRLNRHDCLVDRSERRAMSIDELLEDRRLVEHVENDIVNIERDVFAEASSLVARMLQRRGMVISHADVDQTLSSTHEQLSELREALELDVKNALSSFYAGVASLTLESLED